MAIRSLPEASPNSIRLATRFASRQPRTSRTRTVSIAVLFAASALIWQFFQRRTDKPRPFDLRCQAGEMVSHFPALAPPKITIPASPELHLT